MKAPIRNITIDVFTVIDNPMLLRSAINDTVITSIFNRASA